MLSLRRIDTILVWLVLRNIENDKLLGSPPLISVNLDVRSAHELAALGFLQSLLFPPF